MDDEEQIWEALCRLRLIREDQRQEWMDRLRCRALCLLRAAEDCEDAPSRITELALAIFGGGRNRGRRATD